MLSSQVGHEEVAELRNQTCRFQGLGFSQLDLQAEAFSNYTAVLVFKSLLGSCGWKEVDEEDIYYDYSYRDP